MKPEHYAERTLEIDGWPVHLVIYQLGDKWYCKADNVSPGANLVSGLSGDIESPPAIAVFTKKEPYPFAPGSASVRSALWPATTDAGRR